MRCWVGCASAGPRNPAWTSGSSSLHPPSPGPTLGVPGQPRHRSLWVPLPGARGRWAVVPLSARPSWVNKRLINFLQGAGAETQLGRAPPTPGQRGAAPFSAQDRPVLWGGGHARHAAPPGPLGKAHTAPAASAWSPLSPQTARFYQRKTNTDLQSHLLLGLRTQAFQAARHLCLARKWLPPRPRERAVNIKLSSALHTGHVRRRRHRRPSGPHPAPSAPRPTAGPKQSPTSLPSLPLHLHLGVQAAPHKLDTGTPHY